MSPQIPVSLCLYSHLLYSPPAKFSEILTLPKELVSLETKLVQAKASVPTGPEC